MFRKGLLFLLLLTLLVVGLVGAGNSAAFRAGWSQGYEAAQQVDGDEGRAAGSVPDRSGRYDDRRFGPAFGFFPFFWGVGLLFKLFLFLLLFGFIARLFFRPWHRGGWHRGHRPHEKPPWAYEGGDTGDDKAYKV